MPVSPSETWHVQALSATASMTVREIQVLQGPHIADADDAVMTRMEQRMSTSQAAARKALDELRPIVAPASRARLVTAEGALKKFMELNAQLIALSRRNTNVHSLMLSLDEDHASTDSPGDLLGIRRDEDGTIQFGGTAAEVYDFVRGSPIVPAKASHWRSTALTR